MVIISVGVMDNIFINSFNFDCKNNFCKILYDRLGGEMPIFICIGSDLVVGDSLGPLVGTLLKNKNLGAYVYGTLNFPITAKEIEYARKYIKLMHKNTQIVAIDSAIGKEEDIGRVKITDNGLKPGLGVNKKLESIGDVGILGIVSSKSYNNMNLYNYTRLNLIYKIANAIADGIEEYILNYMNKIKYIKRCI